MKALNEKRAKRDHLKEQAELVWSASRFLLGSVQMEEFFVRVCPKNRRILRETV